MRPSGAKKLSKADEDALGRRIATASELKSEHGSLLLEVVKDRLSSRIEEMISKDPAAMAYVQLLHDFGQAHQAGKHAVAKLGERYMKELAMG